jgi:glycosyltransferase involved in cell wall biosynthesis
VPDDVDLADLVLLPSETEIQSLACLEAQACDRVVLASDIPADRELIADGENGDAVRSRRQLARGGRRDLRTRIGAGSQ